MNWILYIHLRRTQDTLEYIHTYNAVHIFLKKKKDMAESKEKESTTHIKKTEELNKTAQERKQAS